MYNHLDFTECLNTQLLQVTFVCYISFVPVLGDVSCFLLIEHVQVFGCHVVYILIYIAYVLVQEINLVFILECLVYGH
jgi:hypothetical protein